MPIRVKPTSESDDKSKESSNNEVNESQDASTNNSSSESDSKVTSVVKEVKFEYLFTGFFGSEALINAGSKASSPFYEMVQYRVGHLEELYHDIIRSMYSMASDFRYDEFNTFYRNNKDFCDPKNIIAEYVVKLRSGFHGNIENHQAILIWVNTGYDGIDLELLEGLRLIWASRLRFGIISINTPDEIINNLNRRYPGKGEIIYNTYFHNDNTYVYN